MILNALVILIIIASAVVWSVKAKGFGLFSAFLNLVCVVAAGGIAFGLWETVAYILLGFAGGTVFVADLALNSAWGLGLLVPFHVSPLTPRLIVDNVVKANLGFSENANQLGGVVFGALAGAIFAGVCAVSASYLRVGPQVLAYSPLSEEGGAYVVRSKLWVPVDRLTVGLYEHMSRGTLGTSTPLAVYRPAAHINGHMARQGYRGTGSAAVRPENVSVLGKYIVDAPLEALLIDTFKGATPQSVATDTGDAVPTNSLIEGYVVQFDSGAKEKEGFVALTPAQARLVVRTATGAIDSISPFAVIGAPETDAGVPLYRFRMDSRGAAIASAGGGATTTFAFEYLVPDDATPLHLMVKNHRIDVGPGSEVAADPVTYQSPAARDSAVRAQSIFNVGEGGVATGPLDTSRSRDLDPTGTGNYEGLSATAGLPARIVFNRGNAGGLDFNADNDIVSGRTTLPAESARERTIGQRLRVDSFAVSDGTEMVQVTLNLDGSLTQIGQLMLSASADSAVYLVDTNNTRYEPVGFVNEQEGVVTIRYTPGAPIRTLGDAPALDQTEPNQTLVLLFTPTTGVTIASVAIDNSELVRLTGPGLVVD